MPRARLGRAPNRVSIKSRMSALQHRAVFTHKSHDKLFGWFRPPVPTQPFRELSIDYSHR